jgi:hypothetical protein
MFFVPQIQQTTYSVEHGLVPSTSRYSCLSLKSMSATPYSEPASVKDLIELLKVALTIGTAVWVYFRFARERTHARRVEFTIDCTFYGPQEGQYIAEFGFRINNKGLVVHRFRKLRLRVLGVARGTNISRWDQQPSRVAFPESLIDESDVLFSRKYKHIFVEPGVEQNITFVGAIPDNMTFILVRAEFEYEDGRTHSTERVFAPTAPEPSKGSDTADAG